MNITYLTTMQKFLTEEIDLATYFEEVVKKSNNPKSSANWIMTEVLRILKKKKYFYRKFFNPFRKFSKNYSLNR